jgi:predicted signal transduction protein with EAL and GGDEF domain
MYNLSPEVVKPGCTLRELFAHRAERGHLLRDPEQYRAELLAGLSSGNHEKPHRGNGGRARDIGDKSADAQGGGWVSTHEDVTAQRAAQAKIAYMAHHDALTNLPNRLYFRSKLQNHIGAFEPRSEIRGTVSRSRPVQERERHPWPSTRRQLVRQTAERLRELLARWRYVLARLGGDEFAVLQGNIKQPIGDKCAGGAVQRSTQSSIRP